jgi:riboflavin biosynthesis pyrimidine reductase
MRQLHPTYVEKVDPIVAYRYPNDRPWLRANMVSSLDGSAVRDGRSEGLSSAADKEVFGVLRGLADVVLVGAGTARTEGYRALRPKEAYAGVRASLGQRPAPVLALVSGRLDLDPDSQLFHGGASALSSSPTPAPMPGHATGSRSRRRRGRRRRCCRPGAALDMLAGEA